MSVAAQRPAADLRRGPTHDITECERPRVSATVAKPPSPSPRQNTVMSAGANGLAFGLILVAIPAAAQAPPLVGGSVLRSRALRIGIVTTF